MTNNNKAVQIQNLTGLSAGHFADLIRITQLIFDPTGGLPHKTVDVDWKMLGISKGVANNLWTSITGIWLNVPLWICLSRNENRDRVVPEDIVVDMYRTLAYHPPILAEGFDRILFRDQNSDNAWID